MSEKSTDPSKDKINKGTFIIEVQGKSVETLNGTVAKLLTFPSTFYYQ